MLVLVCGDRGWGDRRCQRCKRSVWPCPGCTTRNTQESMAIEREIKAHKLDPEKDVLMHGGAKGADKLCGTWGKILGFKVIVFEADWMRYGKGAGQVRNKRMLEESPELVLAFHPDLINSKGTKNMVAIAKAKPGTTVEVFTC